MEDMLERQILLEIKSRFFDLVAADQASFSYEKILVKMLLALREILEAQEADLFDCEGMKQELCIQATTRTAGQELLSGLRPECAMIKNGRRIVPFIRKPDHTTALENYDLVFVLRKGQSIALLAIQMNNDSSVGKWSDGLLQSISEECSAFVNKLHSLASTVAEEKRYRLLFRVTEKFHSTMDMDVVLGEIISTLQEEYPSFIYYLLLSHDYKGLAGLPVKDLEYDGDNLTAMQAYVSGEIQFEDSLIGKKSIMYAPLKGKQGVYGVLQVIAPDAVVFPQDEVKFIRLLANTAGSALENAKLYEQSRKLISDLQLINETSHQLNSSLRMADTMNIICGQIMDSFKAQEVGFIMIDPENDSYSVLEGSTSFFFSNEAVRYIFEIGERIQDDNESLFIGDFDSNAEKSALPYRSIMGVPMIQSGSLKGFALVLHEEAYRFAFETFKLLQSLIHHSTLAFTNSLLREELEKMVVTDHLTKLYSRSYLDDKMSLSMLEDTQGTFILMDVDNFKGVNDTYGHQVGDDVLIQLARHIMKNIRTTDIGARWGGEELAIYLPGTPLDIGVMIANRLVDRVEKQTNPGVTISCGVSTWIRGTEDSVKSLFKRADQALYVAKSSGKNKVVIQKDDQFEFTSTQE